MNFIRNFGIVEWAIILLIIILIFGVGRITKVAKEMGSGIRSFKDGLQGKEDEEKKDEQVAKETQEEEKKE